MVEKQDIENTPDQAIGESIPAADGGPEIVDLSSLEPEVNEYVDQIIDLAELESAGVDAGKENMDLSFLGENTPKGDDSVLELTEDLRAADSEIERGSDGLYEEDLFLDIDATDEEEFSIDDDSFFDLSEEEEGERGLDEGLEADEPLIDLDLDEASEEDLSLEDESVFELTDEFDLTEEAGQADIEADLSMDQPLDHPLDRHIDEASDDAYDNAHPAETTVEPEEPDLLEPEEPDFLEPEDPELLEPQELTDLTADITDNEAGPMAETTSEDAALEETGEFRDGGQQGGAEKFEEIDDLEEVEMDLADMLDSDEEGGLAEDEEEEFSLEGFFEEEDEAAFAGEFETKTEDSAASDALEDELMEKLDEYFGVDEDAPEESAGQPEPILSEQSQTEIPQPEPAKPEPLRAAAVESPALNSENVFRLTPEQLDEVVQRVIDRNFADRIDQALEEAISRKLSFEFDAIKTAIIESLKSR